MKARWYIAGISLLYALLCLTGMQHHELWQDEAHHILLGRDSHSLAALWRNTAYEGHPLLWNLLLFLLMQAFKSLWLVQLFHAAIATGCVVLILRYAPFSWPVKLLLVFGYFLGYEYSVITRHYSLALLLVILLLVQLSSPRRHWLCISLLLALLCQVHVFGLFLALGFCTYVYSDWRRARVSAKIFSVLILLAGLALALAHSLPPGDHFLHDYNREGWLSVSRIGKLWQVPLKGLLPMPDLSQAHYWNSHVLINHLPWLAAALSLLLLLLPAFLLRGGRLRRMYYLPVLAVLLFFYATPLMLSNRNCGYLSICLFAVLWLQAATASRTEGAGTRASFFKPRYLGYVLLLCQLYAGIACYVSDLSRPFSNSREAAAFINGIVATDGSEVWLSNHGAGPALAIYSRQPVYCLEPDGFETFCRWNTRPFLQRDDTLLHKIGRRLGGRPHVVLVLNEAQRMEALRRTNDSLHILPVFEPELLKAFAGATVGSEEYFVYRLK